MNQVEQLFGQRSRSQDHWLFILSLLISVLLTTFLLLSIVYQVKFHAQETKNSIKQAIIEKPLQDKPEPSSKLLSVQTTPETCPPPKPPQCQTKEDSLKNTYQAIYQILLEEFQHDLPRWSAEIDPQSLTISFRNPMIFFQTGSATLNPYYQQILAEFFPRYIKLLQKFANFIEAVSIQGHTSSEWTHSISIEEAYLNNMILSQERTRTVLEYCLELPAVASHKDWLRQIFITSGLSSSRLILENDQENTQASRRVEFRIFLK